jgi:hypothetical protein
MNHQEWLDSLVQGDKVALRYNGWEAMAIPLEK